MSSPQKLTVPNCVVYCRGRACHNLAACESFGACTYKSSAEEFRENKKQVEKLDTGSVVVTPEPAFFKQFAEELAAVYPAPVVETKPSNPKDLIGSNKVPMHLWPETASAMGAMGLLDGALKYGRSNFREVGVRASIYLDAARRHIGFWFEGEDTDKDSGLPHLAHALACLAIVVDAQAAGKLHDDRMVKGGFRTLMDTLTPHVARLKAQHADKSPKHYTIADNDK